MTVMPSRNRPTPPRIEIAVDTSSPAGTLNFLLPNVAQLQWEYSLRVKSRYGDAGRDRRTVQVFSAVGSLD